MSKPSDRQACNSSNWLLKREFKFFSKREAAILGAGSGEVHWHKEQGLSRLCSQPARDPGAPGWGAGTGEGDAGFGFGWCSLVQRTFPGWLYVRTRTPPLLTPVAGLVGRWFAAEETYPLEFCGSDASDRSHILYRANSVTRRWKREYVVLHVLCSAMQR